MNKLIRDPSIPYIGPIYGGRFVPGKIVRIQGSLVSVAYRFDINLQCGPQTVPRDDIAIQISVHILDGYISTNYLQNGIWGEQQRGALPIKRAEKFEIIIACEFNQYKVTVNGQHYCTFPQKIHYDRISHLAVEGDVSIVQISYEEGAGDGFCGTSAMTALVSENDNFEIINPRSHSPHPKGLNPQPNIGFSPPSYETATHAPKQEGAAHPTPYPTNAATAAPYPTATGTPYPTTTGAPYPTKIGAPYPITTGPSYPTSSPAPYPTRSPYSTQTVVPLNAQPLNATAPLNAGGSYFRPRNYKMQKWAAGCIGFFFVSIIIIAAVVIKTLKKTSYRNHH